jgi:ATP-binding cassette subfamily C protein LapB
MLREYATVQEFFSSATLLALVDLPFVILFLGVLYVIAPACAFATAAAIPIVAVTGYLIQRKIAASSAESFADGQEKHGALVETLVSLEAVRGLGAERAMRRRWRERVAAHAVTGSHMRFYSLLAVNVSVSVQQFAGLVVVLAGVLAIHAGTMSMGALVAAVMLSSRALAPLASLAQIMSRAALTKTAMKAITAFMDTPSERPAGRKFVDRPQLQGQIEARDLCFHYPARTPVAVLQDLNLTIRPGERVGILGRIGSGKSTLLKLMMGLYQPTEGAVYHDGVDLRQLDPAQLRAQVAFVAQAPVLFSGTIKENIAIARPEATDAEIIDAARVAGVDAFVSRHPMGYDLPVQERGEGLSIGQRQAIALAQALLKGADVLLLDEPTSAFDESTEAGFRRTLVPWLAGKTLVIVTHKLSMLELVDRVILVDDGRIVMDGPKEVVLRALMKNEEGRPADQTESDRIAQEAQRRVREAQRPGPAAAATQAEAVVEAAELTPDRGALGPPRLDWRSSLETEGSPP